MNDIKLAIKILTTNGTKKKNIVLLHCNSDYPTPFKDTNLNSIKFLQSKFNIKVGFSDHTLGIEASIGAVTMGAQ